MFEKHLVAALAFTLPIWIATSTGGCRSKEPSPTGAVVAPASATAAASLKLGAPIRSSTVVPLTSIAKDTEKYAKTTVKTEGRVSAVCQAMGCWMEIVDTNSEAHIRMSGHSFFIPKNAAGRRAFVEGTVLPRPDNGACEQEAAEATGKTVKVELDATGVELL
jgi:Domain of unknown function (DUF4920)